jgi:hypothetical protein
MPNTNLATWDFQNHHVQTTLSGQQFIAAQTVLIAAGPPRLAQAGFSIGEVLNNPPNVEGTGGIFNNTGTGQKSSVSPAGLLGGKATFAWPMGVTESVGIAQNKQLTRLFEIGSRRSYFIVGRTVNSATIARTLYDGPNLLRALYAYYPRSFHANQAAVDSIDDLLAVRDTDFVPLLRVAGYADFFINLDSDLFDHPFGLLLMFLDSQNQIYGACYAEDCFLQNHQFGVSSQANLIGEGVTLQFDQLLPINVGAQNASKKAALSRSGVRVVA